MRRLGRAASASALATFVALCSHVLGGGEPPSPAAVLIPFVVALPVCLALIGMRPSIWRITGVVVASQAVFHGFFALGAPTGGLGVLTAHVHGGHVSGVARAAAELSGTSEAGGMLIAHLLAAAVTSAALYAGDRALLGLHALAIAGRDGLRRLRALSDDPAIPAWRPAAPGATAGPSWAATLAPLRSGPGWRGPPLPC